MTMRSRPILGMERRAIGSPSRTSGSPRPSRGQNGVLDGVGALPRTPSPVADERHRERGGTPQQENRTRHKTGGPDEPLDQAVRRRRTSAPHPRRSRPSENQERQVARGSRHLPGRLRRGFGRSRRGSLLHRRGRGSGLGHRRRLRCLGLLHRGRAPEAQRGFPQPPEPPHPPTDRTPRGREASGRYRRPESRSRSGSAGPGYSESASRVASSSWPGA